MCRAVGPPGARVPHVGAVPDSFRALVAEKSDDDVARALRELNGDDLPDGDVVVRVDWSSVNYKDALAVSPKGRVAQISPLVDEADLDGALLVSNDPYRGTTFQGGRITLPDGPGLGVELREGLEMSS